MSIEHPLTTPLIQENPLALRVLGLCPALAITNSLTSALIMSAALTVVLILSNTIISLVRKLLPSSVRLIVQITVDAPFWRTPWFAALVVAAVALGAGELGSVARLGSQQAARPGSPPAARGASAPFAVICTSRLACNWACPWIQVTPLDLNSCSMPWVRSATTFSLRAIMASRSSSTPAPGIPWVASAWRVSV